MHRLNRLKRKQLTMLINAGHSIKVVADRANVSPSTVKAYLYRKGPEISTRTLTKRKKWLENELRIVNGAIKLLNGLN
jgi:transposase